MLHYCALLPVGSQRKMQPLQANGAEALAFYPTILSHERESLPPSGAEAAWKTLESRGSKSIP